MGDLSDLLFVSDLFNLLFQFPPPLNYETKAA